MSSIVFSCKNLSVVAGESKISVSAASDSSEEGELHMVEEDSNQSINNNNHMEDEEDGEEGRNSSDLKDKLIKMSLGRIPPLIPLGLPTPTTDPSSDPREQLTN